MLTASFCCLGDCQAQGASLFKDMNLLVSHARQGRRPILARLAAANCLLLAACGQPAGTPTAPSVISQQASPVAESTEGAVTVVFLGDSLTAGYGLSPADALPAQVEAFWRTQQINAVAINAGVSGDTTANGLARFDWSVSAAKPDLLVVALGANDFLMGIDPAIARSNLEAILDRAAQEDIRTVLVGLELRGDVQQGSLEAAYARIYPELAEAYQLDYYPSLLAGIEATPSMLQPDGLHPTQEGVVTIAKPLAEFLTPIVQSIEK